MTSLRHLRSSTANKRPDPAAMVDGQLAMNYDIASPGLFFKDDNGTLIKVGPVHVGTTAPNVSPAAGGTAGNSTGEQWLDTTGGVYVLKVWDGSAWRSESGTFVDVSGDTMTGALTMADQGAVRFSETTANGSNYIALQATASLASNKTITLPDTTGTVVTTGDTGTVTSTMIANDTILNADINASAAIAGTKISPDFGSQTIATTGLLGIDTSSPAEKIDVASAGNLLLSNKTTAPSNSQSLPGSLILGGKGWNTSLGSQDIQGTIKLAGSYSAGIGAVNPRLAFSLKSSVTSSSLTEQFNIDSNGRVGIGIVDASGLGNPRLAVASDLTNPTVSLYTNTNSAYTQISFVNSNGAVGSIVTAASSTAYNTSSDYRLKENITLLDGAIARLNQLSVHRFNFIADPDTVLDGFIAHEAAAVVPECVTGEKDAVDDDDNPIYQGIDQSKLVPLLTAALQEAIAKIDALETRIAALELN